MKTALKSLLLIAVTLYLIFALVKVSRPASEMLCTGVELQMADSGQVSLIDRNMVERLLAKHKIAPKGNTMGSVNTQHISRLLSESPYIDTVICQSMPTGKLCIRVVPKHPVLHFITNDDDFYLTQDGDIVPAGGLSANLAIVSGHTSRKQAAKLLPLGKLLQNDKYWAKQIQLIYIDKEGHLALTPNYSGQTILLGQPTKLEQKLQRVRTFYETTMPKVGWNKYSVINATYDNQIICKKIKK